MVLHVIHLHLSSNALERCRSIIAMWNEVDDVAVVDDDDDLMV